MRVSYIIVDIFLLCIVYLSGFMHTRTKQNELLENVK